MIQTASTCRRSIAIHRVSHSRFLLQPVNPRYVHHVHHDVHSFVSPPPPLFFRRTCLLWSLQTPPCLICPVDTNQNLNTERGLHSIVTACLKMECVQIDPSNYSYRIALHYQCIIKKNREARQQRKLRFIQFGDGQDECRPIQPINKNKKIQKWRTSSQS